MNKDLVSLYTDRRDIFEREARQIQQQEITTSWFRVGLMVGILLMIYVSFQVSMLWWLVLLMMIGYGYLVKRHEHLKHQLKLLQTLVMINEWEIKSQENDNTNFADGSEYIDSHHPYTFDLDIFGSGSLFQRINRTSTETGKEKLANVLANPLISKHSILSRQEAVEELKSRLDFRQKFQAVGLSSPEKKEDQGKILDWLQLPSFIYGRKSFRWMLILFPTLSMGSLLLWIISGFSAPFVVITLVQWGIIGRYAKRVTLFQNYIGNKRHLLGKFAEHFDLLNKEDLTGTITKELREEAHEAGEELLILASRSRALDLRLNLLATLLFNSTILYDLQCVYKLEQWRERNRARLEKWLQAIADTDALNSLATFAFNHPAYVTPEISEQQELSASSLGHPLISDSDCVTNDVSLQKNSSLWIVTGANMAGKSTFLRTVGVNAVLALTGSVVCAKKMICPLVEVFSGMRNTDSINENQSYFYAELLRLHSIIERLREGKPMLVLLDEILKGTNSVDKLNGSQELLKQLTKLPCLALIATHDVALSEMEKEFEQIRNFHFETRINGDELLFDYKLYSGVSTGKNATFLMRRMGIIPS
ncbi:MAG TPA: hypothetical protein VFW11_18825 [Cyclobacteriaceae bacterium]|nr:hypothetical protein [Cyclobacteriaceae bacterium]